MWGVRQGIQAISPHACGPDRCGGGRLLPLLDILRNCGGLQRRGVDLLRAAMGRVVRPDDNLLIEGVMGGDTAGRVRKDITRRSDANDNFSAHVGNDIEVIAKTLGALRWCCDWPRSFIAGLAAAISVLFAAFLAAEVLASLFHRNILCLSGSGCCT